MTTPPGWYDDGHGSMRWWDGMQWTEHVAAPDDPSMQADEQQMAETIPMYQAAGGTLVPAAPQGGGYRPEPPAAFPVAAEPRKSKVWIVWVVVGVVLLGVVVALAIVVPMIFLGLTTGAGSSGAPTGQSQDGTSTEPAAEEPADEEPAEPPSAADEQEAADAVESYNDAWMVGDCETYFATTTEPFREYMEATNCESFTIQSRNFAGAVDNFTTTIGDVETIGNTISVSTTETFTSIYDDEGNQTDEPVDYEDRYEYVLVSSNGVWVIDDIFLE